MIDKVWQNTSQFTPSIFIFNLLCCCQATGPGLIWSSPAKTLIKVTKFSSTECILQAEYLNFIGLWVSFDVRVHGDGGTEMAGACLWLSYIGAAEKMSRNEWEMWEKLFNTIIGSEQSCWPGHQTADNLFGYFTPRQQHSSVGTLTYWQNLPSEAGD